MQHRTAIALIGAAALLAACGKVQEAASEKAAEKMIEAAASKEGVNAKVDLSGNSVKVTSTDEKGQTTTLSMGNAPVTEADLGVPFYPGTKPAEGSSTRVETPDGVISTVELRSGDAPDKVAAFYRDNLKGRAAGKQMMDVTADGATTLVLSDEAAKSSVQIHVGKADAGSEIVITASRGAVKN